MEAVSEKQIEDILAEGVSAVNSGQRAAAKEFFRRVTRERPSYDLGWFWLASVTESLQMRLSYLKTALDLNPENAKATERLVATKIQFARALIAQGTNAAKNGIPEHATYFLLHAAELDPGNEEVWLALAQLDEPPEDANDLLRRVLTINPGNGRAIAMLDETERARPRPVLSEPIALQEVTVEEQPTSPAPVVEIAASEPAEDATGILPLVPAANPAVTEKTFELPPVLLPSIPALATQRTPNLPPLSLPPAPPASFEKTARELSLARPPAPLPKLVMESPAAPPMESLPPAGRPASVTQFTHCPLCEQELGADLEQCCRCGGKLVLKNFVLVSNIPATGKFDRRRSLLAVARYSQALTKDSENAQIHYNLGLAYLNLNRPDVAMRCLRRAEQLCPDAGLSSAIDELARAQSQGQPVLSTEPPAPGQPATPGPAAAPAKDPGRIQEKQTGKQKSILVVDDSPTIRKLVAYTLEKCGYRVIPAVDGSDALAKVGEVKPDLVFLDVVMPNLDGYQVCKFIREMKKDLPVVMLSGKDGFFDKVRGKVAGSTAYITKPFDAQTLIEAARKYCPMEA